MARAPSARDCSRALWLLGLDPPVTATALQTAYRARIARAHPDRHLDSAARAEAAHVLTRALNAARDLLADWIDSDRPWPARAPAAPPRATTAPGAFVAPVCRTTGLRAGDHIRVWPYEGDPQVVSGTDVEAPGGPAWVLLRDGGAVRADRVRLAAFQCPACGRCAGPVVEQPTLRPCPDCLVDLRGLERRPEEAARVRSAIEARAQAGIAEARGLGDDRLEQRAAERRRWARRLRQAPPEDVRAALVSAFTHAFDRWTATV
jgi:hypothetical protein